MKEFLGDIPNLIGIAALMFSTFLIGYFSAYWSQKSRFGKVIQSLQDQLKILKGQINNKDQELQRLYEEESAEAELEEKILSEEEDAPILRAQQKEILPVASVQEDLPDQLTEEPEIQAAEPEMIAQKARTSYITYTKQKPELDFESFGMAGPGEKDDLTQIVGIGPYIEQRLNDIGIFNYDQISQLKPADIRAITELIDFFPGRIERDDWVGQAMALKVY